MAGEQLARTLQKYPVEAESPLITMTVSVAVYSVAAVCPTCRTLTVYEVATELSSRDQARVTEWSVISVTLKTVGKLQSLPMTERLPMAAGGCVPALLLLVHRK